MIRTFIAAEIPPEMRRNFAADISRFRNAAPLVKWVEPDNLHLTLKFLGDIKESDLGELFSALEEGIAHCEPFALQVTGIGAFPHWRHPRVIWAGCGDGAAEAVQLAEAVEDVCTELGYERERRPFRPHLTLGRVKLPADAGGLGDMAETTRADYGYFDVDSVVVFMSSLRRTGPVYSPMARIPLR